MRKLLVALVVLAVLAVGADRIAARLAAGAAQDQLVTRGVSDPHVQVHGFPFLTQALARHFDHVTVTADAVHRSGLVAESVHADLRDVRLSSASTGTAGLATGSGVVPWSEVASAADIPLTLSAGPGESVRLTGRVEVLGQSLAIVAEAGLSTSGRSVRIRPTTVSLQAGGQLSGAVSQQVRNLLELTYPITGLPAGVRLAGLSAQPAGLKVSVTASDVAVQ